MGDKPILRGRSARRRGRADRAAAAMLAALLAGIGAPGSARAQSATAPTTASADAPPAGDANVSAPAGAPGLTDLDGAPYSVSRISVQYKDGGPAPVPPAELMRARVRLARIGDVFIGPRGRFLGKNYTVGELSSASARSFSASAIQAIEAAVVRAMGARGYAGIVVSPVKLDDRAEGDSGLELSVAVAVVSKVRTIASGDRVPESQKIDSPLHARILANSPVVAEADAGRTGKTDLVRKDLLDRYVLALNRYPDRRVDVALSSAGKGGGVVLDYLVAEARPWSFTAQISNTGTRQTNEWRERFVYANYQLSNSDDTLYVEYNTAGFSDSQTAIVSYDRPLFSSGPARIRGYFSFDDFYASDVGFAGQRFRGSDYVGGVELSTNLLQNRAFFVDGVGGLRFQRADLSNGVGPAAQQRGSADFVEPYIGVRASQFTETVSTLGALTLLGGYSPANQSGLDKLRPNADPTFVVLQGEAGASFFLEPIIDRQRYRSGTGALAQEVAVSIRGQTAFGSRLIPQDELVAGGLYSVRGYPESVVAGDDALIFSAEYRYHLPRAFRVQPDPRLTPLFGQPFRFSPQQPFGAPDWDLIARGFVDAACIVDANRTDFERDNTLVSTGLGLEFVFKQNIDLRVDWGVALRRAVDASGEIYSPGENRFHFAFTFTY